MNRGMIVNNTIVLLSAFCVLCFVYGGWLVTSKKSDFFEAFVGAMTIMGGVAVLLLLLFKEQWL